MAGRQTEGWTVLLIGGASGTGKSTLAARLARHFGVALAEADDFRLALQEVTTPADQPDLHYFTSAPGVAKEGIWERPPQELCDGLIRVGRVVSHALAIVIGHHLHARKPLVLEGDGILPELAVRRGLGVGDTPLSSVRFVLLYEPDEAQVAVRMRGRGPGHQAQARMYWRYGEWLRREAKYFGLPIVAVRPSATLFERVLAVVGEPRDQARGQG